ncbi:MAG: folylpolyglutamate synthase/dihydrofolate synthase family protein [Clostridia bacterium]|jgi:dihydrofolate synthase/folylpolyglutamate synthase|nr:folylpolyglutamate synthase/dihydrofolate synthase family protein [Spirochaetia bacterium]
MSKQTQPFTDSAAVYEYLNRFLNFERKLDPKEYRLDRMLGLRELFSKPDESYKVIHVAGSKGKGSTATMVAAIMELHESPVGLFTSPHLIDFTERIAVDGKPVDTEILLSCAAALADRMAGKLPEDFPGGENPTYFELLTMLGFLCFKEAACKRAVIEVGLGGRLDSTNVVVPEACLITPIELEHTELLGDTIPKVASEKAGIIKAGVPVFTSATRPEALQVFRDTAARLGAPLSVLDEELVLSEIRIDAGGTVFKADFRNRKLFPEVLKLRTPMIGLVQARNAALAALVTRSLGVSVEHIQQGLAKARLRARFEIMPGNPVVVLDGAHTPDSVRACASDFSAIFPDGGLLLFGCAKDKQPGPLARELAGVFPKAIITKPGTFKESDVQGIAQGFRQEGIQATVMEDTETGILAALGAAKTAGLPLLVCGSFYLCAEVAKTLSAGGR